MKLYYYNNIFKKLEEHRKQMVKDLRMRADFANITMLKPNLMPEEMYNGKKKTPSEKLIEEINVIKSGNVIVNETIEI